MAISQFMRGAHGRGAVGDLARKIHQDRIRGRIKISAREEAALIKKATERFVKDGKDPYKIREKDFERDVLNPLRVDRTDLLESDEVDKLAEHYGIEHRTEKMKTSEED